MQTKRAYRWTEAAPAAPAPAGEVIATPWLAEADLGAPVPSPARALHERLSASLAQGGAVAVAPDLPAKWPMPLRMLTIAALGVACWVPILVTALHFF